MQLDGIRGRPPACANLPPSQTPGQAAGLTTATADVPVPTPRQLLEVLEQWDEVPGSAAYVSIHE